MEFLTPIQPPQPTYRYNHKKIDWESYRNNINFPPLKANLETSVKDYTEAIINSFQSSAPRVPLGLYKAPVPWWNDDCKSAIKQRKRALNKFKYRPTTINLIEYKRLRAVSRKIIRQAKLDSWRSFTSSLHPCTPSHAIWKNIRKIKGSPSNKISMIMKGPDPVHDPNQIPEVLAEHYLVIFSKHPHDSPQISEPSSPQSSLNNPLTFQELTAALSRTKNSSPGLDGVTTPFIKNLSPAQLQCILNLFNAIWTEGSIPTAWKNSVLIPLHKPGKSRFSPAGYRPIALTSHIGKLLERIINFRLTTHIQRYGLISPHQLGFTRGYSTTDHLIGFESDLIKSFNHSSHTTSVFLDIEKAFDTIKMSKILDTLAIWNIGGKMYRFIRSFLTNRTFQVKANGLLSSSFPQLNGVPQGSCISPTLFLIAINSISSKIPQHITFRLFADDIALYHSAHDPKESEAHLDHCLSNLPAWAEENGLTFSLTKSTCTHFCRKRHCPRTSNIILGNSPIPNRDSHKFLGVIFDSRLSWLPHIKHIKNKCSSDIALLRSLATYHWGAHRDTLLNIYKAVSLAKLDYGSQCYSSAAPSYLKKLDPIQNSALRIALSAFHTSPTTSLHCEAEIPSLSSRRELSLLKYAATLKTKTNLKHHRIFFRNQPRQTMKHIGSSHIFQNTCLRLGLHYPPPFQFKQTIFPWSIPEVRCDSSMLKYNKESIPKHIIKSRFLQLQNETYPTHFFIYTDGSKTTNHVGSSFSCLLQNCHYKLPDSTGILSAELFAIHRALEFADTLTHQNIAISTDSMSSIQALGSLTPHHPLVPAIQEKYTSLQISGKSITMIWTPSHVGIPGNELADRLASKESEAITVQQTLWATDLKSHLTNLYKHLDQLQWDLQDSNKLWDIKKTFYQKPNLTNIPRHKLNLLTRLKIGHCKLTHEHLLKDEPPPHCESCGMALTVKHILEECPEFRRQRLQCGLASNITEALSLINIDKLYSFLCLIGLVSKI